LPAAQRRSAKRPVHSMNDGNISPLRLPPRRASRAARSARQPEVQAFTDSAIVGRFEGEKNAMTWHIGRTEALSDPVAARRKALARLQGLTELEDPEALVVPILLDAILMVESYRGARHQISFLPELTRNV